MHLKKITFICSILLSAFSFADTEVVTEEKPSTSANISTTKDVWTQITEVAMEEKSPNQDYVNISTTSLFLDIDEIEGKGDGRLLSFAKVKLQEQKDDFVQVEIQGWQPENVAHAIYAEKGKRIMVALLSKAKAEAIEVVGTELDEETDQTWNKVTLTAWMDANNLIADQKILNEYGESLTTQNCAGCHAVHKDQFLANQWPSVLKSMRRFVSMEDQEYEILQSYLQYHAKDMQENPQH